MAFRVTKVPYLLLETVTMLYQYYEGKSPVTAAGRRRIPANPDELRRSEAIDRIIHTICGELDRDDAQMRYYFGRVETDNGFEDIFLAQLMTYSFITLKHPDFHENIREIHEQWAYLQSEHIGIVSHGIAGLIFGRQAKGDLFDQISSLRLPADFRLELYRVFRNFDTELDKLAALIEPFAQRLEQAFTEDAWLFDELNDYWLSTFSQLDPLDFLRHAVGENVVFGAGEDTLVAVSVMDFDEMIYDMVANSLFDLPCNFVYIGSQVNARSSVRNRGGDLDSICAAMKALGDRRRLELIQRLARGRSYCHELAEAMEVDPGNLSRSLSVLYDCGFLTQQRENLRCYYSVDQEAVRRFFRTAELLLLPPKRGDT